MTLRVRFLPTIARVTLGLVSLVALATAAASEIDEDLAAVRQVGPDGAGHVAAQAAAARLAELPPEQVETVLDGFAEASPLAKNWLRVIACSVADNGDFPRDRLELFLADRDRDPDARYLSFQMLTARDPESLPRLIEGGESDPSLPIRYLAISRLLDRAARQQEEDRGDEAIASLRLALAEARSADQLKSAAKSLEKLGHPVDLAGQLELVRQWWTFGTYDHTDSQHFDTVYLPESLYLAEGELPDHWLKPEAPVRRGEAPAGTPAGQVARFVTSDDELGLVDLNPVYDDTKDAITYGYIELTFAGQTPVDAQARLGCINANKVWVNGQLVTANEVYHAGTRIDQYIGQCRIKPGRNTVLVKICQNAQTESWAQDWRFQFRLTDSAGAPLPIELTTSSP